MDNTSIQDLSPRVNYLGDSIKTEFNIPFQIINPDYIEVFVNKIKVTTGYNILTNNIVFSTPPISGESITIMRVIPLEHIESLRTKGILDFDLLDNVITNLVAQVQTVNDKLNRTPMAPVNYTGTASDLFSTFEEATDEALSVLDSVTDIKNQVEVLQNNISEDLGSAVSEATQKSEEAADLAKLWASQDEGLVEELDYSSKKHASRSKEFALEAEDWAKASKNILGDVSQGLRNDLPYGRLIMNGQSASTINGMLLQHNETNFPDVIRFLESGDLKSIDINIFNSRVETNGWCGVFGYDSVNKSFKTPKITNMDQVGVIPHSNGSNRNLGRSLIYQETKETNGIADVDVYSDGWCEQRGLFTTPTGSSLSGTINLVKNYKSIEKYFIFLNNSWNTSTYAPVISAKSISSFNYLHLYNLGGYTSNWNTFGYIEPISDPRNTIFYIQCYNTDIEPEILNYTGALDDYMEDTIIPQINSEAEAEVQRAKDYANQAAASAGSTNIPLLSTLTVPRKLTGNDAVGWAIQGSILPKSIYYNEDNPLSSVYGLVEEAYNLGTNNTDYFYDYSLFAKGNLYNYDKHTWTSSYSDGGYITTKDIVSNFSVSDRLKIQGYINFKKELELRSAFHITFKTGTDITTLQYILGDESTTQPQKTPFSLSIQGGKLKLYLSSNGTSWNLAEAVDLRDVVASSTYLIRFRLDKELNILYIERPTSGVTARPWDVKKTGWTILKEYTLTKPLVEISDANLTLGTSGINVNAKFLGSIYVLSVSFFKKIDDYRGIDKAKGLIGFLAGYKQYQGLKVINTEGLATSVNGVRIYGIGGMCPYFFYQSDSIQLPMNNESIVYRTVGDNANETNQIILDTQQDTEGFFIGSNANGTASPNNTYSASSGQPNSNGAAANNFNIYISQTGRFSNKNQGRSITQLLYYRVGNSIQDPQVINANGALLDIINLQNNKMNKNLDNMSQDTIDYILDLITPDRKKGVPLGTNQTWHAPCGGILTVAYATSQNNTNGLLYIEGKLISNPTTNGQYLSGVSGSSEYILKKGSEVIVRNNWNVITFYPFYGANYKPN